MYRLDTRIYLKDEAKPGHEDLCVGAIIGKNPGSAKPGQGRFGELVEIDLDGDDMLPKVRRWYREAFLAAGVVIEDGMFVQVWNLFYLCGKNLKEAKAKYSRIQITDRKRCTSEGNRVPILWFAWGGPDDCPSDFKNEFSDAKADTAFYFDKNSGRVVGEKPGLNAFAKHPQGMPKAPVVEFLAEAIRRLFHKKIPSGGIQSQ